MSGRHRVGALVELPYMLKELGHDPTKVIASADVDPALLDDPEGALSFVELGRLLKTCVDVTGCQHFSLLVGQRAAVANFGLVGQLMRNAPTLGDALLDLCRDQIRYIRGAVVYLIVRHDTAYLGYSVYIPGIEAMEQITDGAMAIGINVLRELADVAPDEALTSRAMPEDVGIYHQCLGISPRFEAEQNALVFPAALLARPVRGADPELRRVLEKEVANYWAVQRPSITDQVVRILRARVIFGEVTVERVAQDLLMQPRTLSRRLRAEGVSFRELRNQARFDVARTLLAGTRMGVTDLALTLGYAETSAFTHAFRRWAGKAPSQWRNRPRAA